MQSLCLVALALAAVAAAQNVVTIQVGATASTPGGIFQFMPPTVNATNGTVINFQFSGMPGNHSVTQSSFTNPCTPLSGGFDSGWVFLPTAGLSPIPEWNLTITNDSAPIWFFCKQLLPSPHCSVGMVGAINAPMSGNTFANFKSNAMAFMGPSGQEQGALIGQGASASADPGPLPSGASTLGAPPPAASATAPSGSSISGGATSAGTASPTTTSNSAPSLNWSQSVVALFLALFAMLLA